MGDHADDNDDDGQRINCDQKSSLEPSALVGKNAKYMMKILKFFFYTTTGPIFE